MFCLMIMMTEWSFAVKQRKVIRHREVPRTEQEGMHALWQLLAPTAVDHRRASQAASQEAYKHKTQVHYIQCTAYIVMQWIINLHVTYSVRSTSTSTLHTVYLIHCPLPRLDRQTSTYGALTKTLNNNNNKNNNNTTFRNWRPFQRFFSIGF